MITATAAFRHDSIATAQQTMARLAATTGDIRVTVSDALPIIDASLSANYDVLMFALTSGELALDARQKSAIVDFVAGGKGFVGIHSAADTLYEWPEYGRLIGAYFRDHPWTQDATIVVEQHAHPSTSGLGDRFSLLEEIYVFQENPRPRVQVLLRLDAMSVAATGDFPLAWSHTFGNGRSYYNALGHFASTWNDSRFQQQLLGAIRWAGGR
jgi:type 1 glutamine amidotransferase